ncbi:unnamed protein product, partial [Ectocarpus sp. 13 AM-2016]
MRITDKQGLPCLLKNGTQAIAILSIPLKPAIFAMLYMCSTNGKKYRVPCDVLCRPHAILGCALPPAGRNINSIRSNLRTCLPVGYTGSSKPPYHGIGLEPDVNADHRQSTVNSHTKRHAREYSQQTRDPARKLNFMK